MLPLLTPEQAVWSVLRADIDSLGNILGFTRFLLRGQARVDGEWQVGFLEYNCDHLHRLMAR